MFKNILTILFFISTSAIAQEELLPKTNAELEVIKAAAIPTPEPVIRTGVIASTAQSKNVGAISVGVAGDDPESFGEQAAITAGVRNNAGKCIVTLNNSHKEKSFRVRYKVTGSSDGRKLFSRAYSGSIAPSGKLVKDFSCKKEAILQLELKSVLPVS